MTESTDRMARTVNSTRKQADDAKKRAVAKFEEIKAEMFLTEKRIAQCKEGLSIANTECKRWAAFIEIWDEIAPRASSQECKR